ncbi:MAG: tRNA (adenosine(37)-N6)-threonylcarbamoyltransferase complex dimerization subunit type 1 TsaB, partial [Arenicellales bacterium]
MTSAQNDTSATTLLALDTATELCSVALLTEGQVFFREQLDPQGHSRLVLQMIEQVLEEGKTKRSDLEAVSYDAGPGSFTGIRIGAGVAQGISIGLKIPVLGVSSLMILAESVGDQ